jgi:MFS family permease
VTKGDFVKIPKSTWAALIVASLGYFVDIYDLILFSIVRVPSLKSLGLPTEEILEKGVLLLNLQMAGMLIGGIFFGIMGDKLGRLSVLFGSIVLYSVANFLNGFVQNIDQYAVLRLIAGIGLAGELGAGITLVSELFPKDKRGYGTTMIATIGVSGALLAWFVADHFDWRIAYMIGGGMGLLLLLIRVGVAESGLFSKTKNSHHVRGDFLSLFRSRERFMRFMACIGVGLPIWYVVGILITLSPEFSKELNTTDVVNAGKAVFFCYFGLSLGDLTSGLVSQWLQSRKKSIFLFLSGNVFFILIYFFYTGLSVEQFYLVCFGLGFSSGYWAMFATVSAEQFGTNLRATVATSAPNFVRGSLVLMSFFFTSLKPEVGLLHAGLLTGMVVMTLSYLGLWKLKESFHHDLDFIET